MLKLFIGNKKWKTDMQGSKRQHWNRKQNSDGIKNINLIRNKETNRIHARRNEKKKY